MKTANDLRNQLKALRRYRLKARSAGNPFLAGVLGIVIQLKKVEIKDTEDKHNAKKANL